MSGNEPGLPSEASIAGMADVADAAYLLDESAAVAACAHLYALGEWKSVYDLAYRSLGYAVETAFGGFWPGIEDINALAEKVSAGLRPSFQWIEPEMIAFALAVATRKAIDASDVPADYAAFLALVVLGYLVRYGDRTARHPLEQARSWYVA